MAFLFLKNMNIEASNWKPINIYTLYYFLYALLYIKASYFLDYATYNFDKNITRMVQISKLLVSYNIRNCIF